jgi:WD40 repeat protein
MRISSKVRRVLFGVVVLCIVVAVVVVTRWNRPQPSAEISPTRKLSTPEGTVHVLAYSPNGAHLAVATGWDVVIYDRATGQSVRTLTAGLDPIRRMRALAYSPDGHALVSAADGDLSVWDAERLVLRQAIQKGRKDGDPHAPKSAYFTGVSFAPDGRTMAVGTIDGVALWDVATGRQTQFTRHTRAVHTVAFSPDGRVLATGDAAGNIQFRDTGTGTTVREFPPRRAYTYAMAFTPEGDLVYGGAWSKEGEPVELWERKTDRFRPIPGGEFDGGEVFVSHLALSPDGRTLAIAEQTKRAPYFRIRLFDVPSGSSSGTIICPEHVNAVAFAPDGREIAAACGFFNSDRPPEPDATHLLIWALPLEKQP